MKEGKWPNRQIDWLSCMNATSECDNTAGLIFNLCDI